MSDSLAYLFAVDVMDACNRSLNDIKFRRDANARNLAKQRKRWFQTFRRALNKLSDYDKEIVDSFMSYEEEIITNLLSLANAARNQGEDFTVMVSSEDFALIKSFYKF